MSFLLRSLSIFRLLDILCYVALCVASLAVSQVAFAADNTYLKQLVRDAQQRQLDRQPQWLRLLHYRPRLLGSGMKSEADDPDFFVSADGKTNPEAELQATLKAFFSTAPWGRKKEPAQCAFIARYEWLRDQLHFDPARLPPQQCEEFDRWIAGINPGSITLVFPSAYLNNPSSMFGHTLLRVDTPGQAENTRLLSYVINYGAATGNDNGVAFAVKGIFGGYPGYFGIGPYYKKVKEYSDTESRDIWEYQLNLTRPEIRRLLAHVWELRGIYFDYYFFDENCSYAVLTLLDVARPSLDLSGRFHGWVIPSDTIRRVAEVPGLVKKVVYRPAAGTRLAYDVSRMPVVAQRAALKLARGELSVADMLRDPALKKQQAEVLLVARDYIHYEYEANRMPRNTALSRSRGLLLARSKLPVTQDTPEPPTPAVRPEQGHRTAMVQLGYGRQDDHRVLQMDLRPAYHDLLDDDGGYVSGAEINFLNLGLRYRQDTHKLSLDHFTLLDIVSLTPRSRFFHPVSWHVSTGWRRSIVPGERSPVRPGYYLASGGGVAYRPWSWFMPYAFADGVLLDDSRLDKHYALGAGLEGGMLVQLAPGWKFELKGRYIDYFAGHEHRAIRYTMAQRYSFNRQQALGLKWQQQRTFGLRSSSLLLDWRWYW